MSPDAAAGPVANREADEGQRELAVRIGLGLFASEAELGHLIAIARQIDVEAGQVLFERGQPVTSVFQLVAGDVELPAPPEGGPAWRVEQRGAVGFLDFARGAAHARTARATQSAQLLELDAADYRDYLEDNYEVGQRIRDRLCEEVITSILATADPAPFFALGGWEPDARSFLELEIPVVERLIMLSRMAPFRGASAQALANLAECASERRLDPGHVIAQRGTDPRKISLLVEGALELELPTGRIARTGRGFVAHLEELAVGPRRTTATATVPTIVLDIDRDDLVDRIEEHFDLGMTLLAFIAGEQARVNDLSATCRVA